MLSRSVVELVRNSQVKNLFMNLMSVTSRARFADFFLAEFVLVFFGFVSFSLNLSQVGNKE